MTSDGLYIGDHFPVIAVIKTDSPSVRKNRLEVKAPPRLKSSDKGGLRRLNRALAKEFSGDISTYSIAAITDWTVRDERKIASSQSSKFNLNGWSPTSRLLQVKLRVLGARLTRLLDGAGTAGCHSMYTDARKDMAAIKLTEDEENWLEENGISRELPPWSEWRRSNNKETLTPIVAHLKSLNTRKVRDELRVLHGGRMRRIQDAADAGKIGPILRSIMAKSKSFSLEVLYNDEGNITDPDEVARIVSEFFKKWFDSSDEDEVRDEQVADYSAAGNEAGWCKLAERLEIPWAQSKRCWTE